ncbi:MAG: serine/threonine protein kinase, partial [Deltaproteobacteria bacterium]|nr:serine/threonine protein kinase [Deltaproteobacteria bacterium]
MAPRMIGPYRVLETLGSGGVGTVYRALDRRTGDPVALKLLSTGPALDPRAARRLAREFETLQDLSHPNVVRVFDTGVFQGYPYLAMELVEGLTLRSHLSLSGEELWSSQSADGHARHGLELLPGRPEDDSWDEDASGDGGRPFGLSAFGGEAPSEEISWGQGPERVRQLADEADEPDTAADVDGMEEVPAEARLTREHPIGEMAPAETLEQLNRPERVARLKDVVVQLCDALAYIHGHGLVHRDLKPTNVMVDQDRVVRLMDFGLAKFLADDAAVTADGRLVGTFRYMAPEQILGEKLDGRADLYSLGVILYELLGGKTPFDAKSPYELWQCVLETEPQPLTALNPRADPQLSRIAHR